MFFKKLLLKSFKSLTPEEKTQVREFLEDEPKKAVDEEISEESKKDEGETEMVEEEKKDEEVTEQKDAGEVAEPTEQTNIEEKNEEEKTETEQQPEVQQIAEGGNGYDINDLVTKDELQERLSALEAKFEAVVKENEDLKEKYENKDFGGFNKKGIIEKDKKANDSYEDYAKDFM